MRTFAFLAFLFCTYCAVTDTESENFPIWMLMACVCWLIWTGAIYL